jgi:hypothetical protein
MENELVCQLTQIIEQQKEFKMFLETSYYEILEGVSS